MKFEVESGGVRYEVEAPDQETAIRALQKLKQSAPQSKEPPAAPTVVEDVIKAAGSGLVTGAHGLVGMVGDVDQMARDAGSWLGNVAREVAGKPTVEGPERLTSGIAPTTEEAMAATGWDKARYEPQTMAGKVAGTAAEFVPGGAALGGGLVKAAKTGGKALVGQLAKNAATYGAVPGAASEVAGQATEGTVAEPFARLGASVAAAGGMNRALRPKASKIPTIDDLKADADQFYGDARSQGLLVSHTKIDQVVDDITRKVQRLGIDEGLHPDAYRALQRLNGAKGVSADLEDLDMLRQLIRDAAVDAATPRDAMRAAKMLNEFDDFLSGLKPADVIAGDPRAAVNSLVKGRSIMARKYKAEDISRIFERALNKVGANYTSAGYQTALRQEFRKIADNPKWFKKFNKDEQKAILQIVRGGKTENALRLLGKFAPRGVVSSAVLMGTTYAAPPLGALLWAGGEGGKAAATRMAVRNAKNLDEAVRSGGPVPRTPQSPVPRVAIPYATHEANRKPLELTVTPTYMRDRNGAPILDNRGLPVPLP